MTGSDAGGGVRIGVDVGGTFTDICYFDESNGRFGLVKIPTTPDDQSRAITSGTEKVLTECSVDGDVPRISYFSHGTTVATNALLEGTGCRVGLVTTAGFGDVLEIGRQRRAHIYDLYEVKPEPLVPRHLRLEVLERVTAQGTVATPLDESTVVEAIQHLSANDLDAVAICLLHSYVNSEHEVAVADRVNAALPDAFVSVSHLTSPEFREFERVSTTVVNAYLGPVMDHYLGNLSKRLRDFEPASTPYVVQSNGGVMSFEDARRFPVKTVLSGPSAGVMGAAHVARQVGLSNVATLDMGGTSADVALVTQGQPRVKSLVEVMGRPMRTQMVDMSTVGAGGGSIAWIDEGGRLKVGPTSAGAVPGPACYGAQTVPEATVTDANLALGYLGPEGLLGGSMTLDREAAVAAVRGLGDRLGLTVDEAASGIVAIANASMVNAIRLISVRKGIDLRDYTLIPFGGAGPLHASAVAAELGMQAVLVPPTPGVLSALGALVTDARRDFSTTRVLPLDTASLSTCSEVYEELESRAGEWLSTEDADQERSAVYRSIDLRYVGQNHELTVSFPSGPIDDRTLADARANFEQAHRQRYGYVLDSEPVQAVTFRVDAVISAYSPPSSPATASAGSSGEPRSLRRVRSDGGSAVNTPVYWRGDLSIDAELTGPAIIEQMDSTVVIAPGDQVRVDGNLNLAITIGAPGGQ